MSDGVRGHVFPKWGPRGPFRVYSWLQAGVSGLALVVAAGLMMAEIFGPPLLLMAVLTALAFRDRTGLPVWNRVGLGWAWLVRGWTGRRRFEPSESTPVPGWLNGVEVLGFEVASGTMGLVSDRGRFLAGLRLSPMRDPWLMSQTDRDLAADDWARIVTSAPSEVIDRVQVLTIVRTGGGERLLADAEAASGPGLDIVKELGAFLSDHVRYSETVLMVRLSHAATRDAARRGGVPTVGGVLYSSLQHLGYQIPADHMQVEILGPSELRDLFDAVLLQPDPDQGTERSMRLAAVDEGWSRVRVGEVMHRVLWMWQWPQRPMTAGFLGPLLSGPGRRVVSVVVEPADTERHQISLDFAHRRAETAVATARGGRHRKTAEMEALDQQLRELNEGHVPVRALVTVLVSATSSDELEDITGSIRANAVAGSCKLAAIGGVQARALGRVLPLCRGLDQGLD